MSELVNIDSQEEEIFKLKKDNRIIFACYDMNWEIFYKYLLSLTRLRYKNFKFKDYP